MRISEGELKRILLSSHSVTSRQLAHAVTLSDRSLAEALVELDLATEDQLAILYAKSIGMPYIALDDLPIPPSTLETLPERLAKANYAIAFEQDQHTVKIALADPEDTFAITQLAKVTQRQPLLFAASRSQIVRALTRYSEPSPTVHSEQSIAKAFQTLLEDALKLKATAVHIDPGLYQASIRRRIDGVLHPAGSITRTKADALTRHARRLAGANPYKPFAEDDYHTQITVAGRPVSARIIFTPITHGYRMTIHINTPLQAPKTLTELGLTEQQLRITTSALRASANITLVAGPIGSGITVTARALEAHLHAASTIRLDAPRDQHSARTAILAAIEGQSVISPLNAPNAASALARFSGFSSDAIATATAVGLVIAQRLARKLCTECRVAYKPSATETRQLKAAIAEDPHTYRAGVGCNACSHSGYRGRVALFEVLPVTESIRELIACKASSADITHAAVREGMTNLVHSGLTAVSQGVTDFAELKRLGLT